MAAPVAFQNAFSAIESATCHAAARISATAATGAANAAIGPP